MSDKASLRKALRRARAGLSRSDRQSAVMALTARALRTGLLRRYLRIGFYIPMSAEADLMPLLNHALWQGRHCYLPQVPARGRRLTFGRVEAGSDWYLNRYGIPEVAAAKPYQARQLDLLFVPLLGFDGRGYRIGMGGGYYDATLAYLSHRRAWRKPLLVGIAFDCQHVDTVPGDPWDVPLDAVITERAVYHCSRRI